MHREKKPRDKSSLVIYYCFYTHRKPDRFPLHKENTKQINAHFGLIHFTVFVDWNHIWHEKVYIACQPTYTLRYTICWKKELLIWVALYSILSSLNCCQYHIPCYRSYSKMKSFLKPLRKGLKTIWTNSIEATGRYWNVIVHPLLSKPI